MTATSPESTPSSNDTINVLPTLSEAKAPVSLTLTIDKSVSKVAAWAIAVIIGSAILIGAGIVLMVWLISANSRAERESRMLQYYVLEMDAKLIAAGVKKPEEAVADKLRQEK